MRVQDLFERSGPAPAPAAPPVTTPTRPMERPGTQPVRPTVPRKYPMPGRPMPGPHILPKPKAGDRNAPPVKPPVKPGQPKPQPPLIMPPKFDPDEQSPGAPIYPERRPGYFPQVKPYRPYRPGLPPGTVPRTTGPDREYNPSRYGESRAAFIVRKMLGS